jgi:hypothetical protein
MTENIADWNIDEVVALMARAYKGRPAPRARPSSSTRDRPTREIIVTAIKGEGKETQSPPAKQGDWVVRNRCPETGNEQYLVTADRFTTATA